MSHTIHFDMKISKGRKVELILPPEVPLGDAELTVVVVPKKSTRGAAAPAIDQEYSPLSDLEGIIGLWGNREGLTDPAACARELRDNAWRRRQ